MVKRDSLNNSTSNPSKTKNKHSKIKYIDMYEFYEHIKVNNNHSIVNNAINSVFSTLNGLDTLPDETSKSLKEMEKMIKKYLPDMITFFDC